MSLSIICLNECVNHFSGVGSDQIIWSWSEDGEAHARTNIYTIFSLRMFGDLNFDDTIDAADYAAASSLTEHGWGMPVASNTLRKVELKTDLLIPGHLILSMMGDAQLRVWTTATPAANDTPLLITGQTITNGVDGASFGAYPSSAIYIEAISSGTATLTYSYVGTGSAEGFGYQAQLDMTAAKVEFKKAILAERFVDVTPITQDLIPPGTRERVGKLYRAALAAATTGQAASAQNITNDFTNTTPSLLKNFSNEKPGGASEAASPLLNEAVRTLSASVAKKFQPEHENCNCGADACLVLLIYGDRV